MRSHGGKVKNCSQKTDASSQLIQADCTIYPKLSSRDQECACVCACLITTAQRAHSLKSPGSNLREAERGPSSNYCLSVIKLPNVHASSCSAPLIFSAHTYIRMYIHHLLWPRLKYVNNHWSCVVDCHEVLSRHSRSLQNES